MLNPANINLTMNELQFIVRVMLFGGLLCFEAVCYFIRLTQ